MSTITTRTGRTSVRATAPLTRWRTVDLLTVAFLGAAFGIAYWGWGLLYEGPSTALGNLFPPLAAFLYAPWLIAGVVGGLVVRRPGAALLCEVVAAVVEMLPGSQWGFSTLISGILQGLGAELAFLILGYGSFGLVAAVFAGALAAPIEAVYEVYTYYPDWSFGYQVAYVVSFAAGGAVLAGVGGWLITKALAKAGALNAFPPGQEERERHAV
jgi:energy-coupling factor transport system substrate-specific component